MVRDKDGISAALALLSLASRARAGRADPGWTGWDALELAHGVHLSGPSCYCIWPTREPGGIMGGLRAAPPAELAGQPVL